MDFSTVETTNLTDLSPILFLDLLISNLVFFVVILKCFVPIFVCGKITDVLRTDTLQTPGNLSTTSSTGGGAHVLPSPALSSNGSVGGSKQRQRSEFGGSHGSLDALASGPERESFFALLRDLGAQSSGSGSSSNGNGSLVPSRSSPERDLDDPVHAKPVGCAPSRLAELLKPNFHSTRAAVSNTQSEPVGAVVPLATGSFSLAVQQQQSGMLR